MKPAQEQKLGEPTFLFFDTETTGLPAYRKSLDHEDNAWPIQIGWIVTDEDFNILSEYDKIVCPPEGVECHPRALEVHGIGPEKWNAEGVPIKEALIAFTEACESVKDGARVAYNIAFDDRIMRSAFLRVFDIPVTPSSSDADNDSMFFGDTVPLCAMLWAADFCNVPGPNGGKRNLKLEQAYRRVTGHKMQGAHDALSDVKATLTVFAEIMRIKDAKALLQE